MSKQTSVEWLKQSIENTSIHWGSELYYNQKGDSFNYLVIRIQPEKLDEFFHQALQKEKEQIEDAYLIGLIHPLEMEATKQAKQYYNETYGGDHE
jgi:uncharacterized protein YaaR (DUF327 family)